MQLKPLTGLRGIAAYSVLIAHAITPAFSFDGVNPLQVFAFRLGYFGMSLFFVLSGFVIHYNYANRIKSAGIILGGYEFLVARLARLYPLYAVAIIFSLDSIPSVIFSDNKLGALSYITLTQSWFNYQNILLPPSWSISTEWFFYLTFILIIPLFDRIRKPLITFITFLIAIFLLLPMVLEFQTHLFNDRTVWVIYFSPFTRIFDFIAGCLASVLFLSYRDSPQTSSLLGFIGIVFCMSWIILIIAFDPISSGKFSMLMPNFIFVPAIASLLVLSCRFDTLLSSVLASRPLTFMGEISYSVYLLGFMIMTALAGIYVWHHASTIAYINSCIKLVGMIIFTTFIAYGSFNLFEKPSRLWVKKILTLKKGRKVYPIMPSLVSMTHLHED